MINLGNSIKRVLVLVSWVWEMVDRAKCFGQSIPSDHVTSVVNTVGQSRITLG